MKTSLTRTIFALLAAAAAASPACAQSLEDKLRDQLRSTLNELHELQDQHASLQAQKAAAEQERDALKAQLTKAQAQPLAAEVANYKQAANQASGTAQAAQADRDKLQTTLAAAQKQLGTCEEKNTRLLRLGNDILDAYQQFDLGAAIAANEPFISIRRVELENMAQDFDDRLHAGRFDPHAKQPATPAGSGQQAPSPGGNAQQPPGGKVQQAPSPGGNGKQPPAPGGNGP